MIGTMLSLIVLLFPFAAHAEEMTVFSLRLGETAKQSWEMQGEVLATRTKDGTHIEATGTGILFLQKINIQTQYQGLELITSSTSDQSLRFVWRRKENGILTSRYEYPIFVDAGSHIGTRISFANSELWKSPIDEIGIVLLPGSSITIEEVRFLRWNAFERLKTALSAFWDFDQYSLYSINFLWGPQIAEDPIRKALMWQSLPPNSSSATYLINWFVVLGVIAITLHSSLRGRGTRYKRIAIFIAAVWIFFDARMGSEFLSWVHADYKEYIAAPEGDRVFRGLDDFYEFADFAKPLVQDRERYVIFMHKQYPYLGNMRYITYPSVPSNDFSLDTWVVYNRPDIQVSPEGLLVMEGNNVLASTGTVLGWFNEASFVFRTN